MEIRDSAELIKQVPLFKGLGDSDSLKLAQIANVDLSVGGSDVFRQGSIGKKLFVVKFGTVRVLKKAEGMNKRLLVWAWDRVLARWLSSTMMHAQQLWKPSSERSC
jgi:hypothetical protein